MRCEVLSRSGERAHFYISPGESVGHFVQKVATKFKYPESSIRLFYCGKELRPNSGSLDSFNFGKFGNLIHMTTSTIDLVDNDNNLIVTNLPILEINNSSNVNNINDNNDNNSGNSGNNNNSNLIDLTTSNDLTNVSSTIGSKRKYSVTTSNNSLVETLSSSSSIPLSSSVNSVSLPSSQLSRSSTTSSTISSLTPLSIDSFSSSNSNSDRLSLLQSNKALRLNISRALHHRLCIVETKVLDQFSELTSNVMEFIIQGSEGVKDRNHVFLGTSVSCSCEDSLKNIPCKHMLFILIKVFKFPSDSSLFFQNPIHFTQTELKRLLMSKGYLSSSESGVLYSGERAATSTLVQASENKRESNSGIEVIEPEECCVCLRQLLNSSNSVKAGDNLVVCQNCQKQIHQFCIEQWQNRSETCPYCRHPWIKKKVKNSQASFKSN